MEKAPLYIRIVASRHTYQHFLEPVVHRFLIHPLDDGTLLLDLVDVVAGMGTGHGVAARVVAHSTPATGFLRSAKPCVQLQQGILV